MSVQMVRFTTAEANVREVEAAIELMITAIQEAQPADVRYAACKLADGVTFLLILELADGTKNPLPSIPEARTFQQRLSTWATEPPAPQPVSVVGSYRLFLGSSPFRWVVTRRASPADTCGLSNLIGANRQEGRGRRCTTMLRRCCSG